MKLNLILLGGYNTTDKPGRMDATLEEVHAEVHRCMDTYGKYPGYMFFGFKIANSLNPQDNMASVFPLIKEAAIYRQNIRIEF